MNALHPELLPALAHLPDDRPVALFTRHSIREQPQDRFAGYDVPLTPAGVALAEAWGGQLGRPLHRALSSPVGRCVETARAMALGAGQPDLAVEPHRGLVEPGCFVRDIRAVGPTFLQHGPVAFANLHFSQPLPGIRSPAEGSARLLDLVRGHLGPAGTLSLMVTHDTILAAFIYTLAGVEAIAEPDWPWMMEGAFLWFDEDAVHWLWRGRQSSRSLDSIAAGGLPVD